VAGAARPQSSDTETVDFDDDSAETRMRSRSSDALNSQVMLPTWFITVLGPLPPAKDTDGWMETATDVLVYRATYQVAAPIVALGSPPDRSGTRRAARYERLTRELRRWDQ
jgi:hypothetical protein